jgi:hypothetical protein
LPVIVHGGFGFTVITKVLGAPGQLVPPAVKTGVTVTVPEIGAVVVFVAVNEMFPVPLAGNPIAVFEFVQV